MVTDDIKQTAYLLNVVNNLDGIMDILKFIKAKNVFDKQKIIENFSIQSQQHINGIMYFLQFTKLIEKEFDKYQINNEFKSKLDWILLISDTALDFKTFLLRRFSELSYSGDYRKGFLYKNDASSLLLYKMVFEKQKSSLIPNKDDSHFKWKDYLKKNNHIPVKKAGGKITINERKYESALNILSFFDLTYQSTSGDFFLYLPENFLINLLKMYKNDHKTKYVYFDEWWIQYLNKYLPIQPLDENFLPVPISWTIANLIRKNRIKLTITGDRSIFKLDRDVSSRLKTNDDKFSTIIVK